jgi:hypothetical protein
MIAQCSAIDSLWSVFSKSESKKLSDLHKHDQGFSRTPKRLGKAKSYSIIMETWSHENYSIKMQCSLNKA